MNKSEIADMAELVAKAVLLWCCMPGERWGELNEHDRVDFQRCAYSMIAAHDGWLANNGYQIVKAGPDDLDGWSNG